MDLNPLDPKVASAPTGGTRRSTGGDSGFKGVMQLMAHLATRDPGRAEDIRRPAEPSARPSERAASADQRRSERASERAAEDTAPADPRPPRERRHPDRTGDAGPTTASPPDLRQAASPAAPPHSAAVVAAPEAGPAGETPAVPAETIEPTLPGVPAAETPASASAASPDAQAQAAQATTAQSPNAQTAGAQTAGAQTAGAQTAGAQTLAAQGPAVQTPATQTPATQTPVAQGPAVPTQAAETPIQPTATPTTGSSEAPAAKAPPSQAPLVQAPIAQAPLAQAPAAQAPAGREPAPAHHTAPAPHPTVTAAPDPAAPTGTDAGSKRMPPEVRVSVDQAPVVARTQGTSSAVLVQAHLAAAGDPAGKAAGLAGQGLAGLAGQGLAGQPAAAQPTATLHVGGGQALFVGADAGNAQSSGGQTGDGAQGGGGQNGGGQNAGGQPGGGQAGAGFAFGAATIGQRGFGGDAARAQFQEILSTRTARVPLQGPGGTGATAPGTPSPLSFTAGPGGPQSTLPTAMASRAEATAQGRPGALPSTAVGQVAVKLASSAADGGGRVTIRLNPEELGKVDVKLELGRDGSVRALISAEKPETLDMLQRDARLLEKALQEAGLKTDQNSLAFDLRGGNGQPADRGDRQVARGPGGTDDTAPDESEIAAETDAGGVRADGSYDLVA